MAKDEMDRNEGPGAAELERLRTRVAEFEASATRHQGTEEVILRLAKENAIIAEIGRIVSSSLDIEGIYEKFAAEARKLLSFDRITISLNGPDDLTGTMKYESGIPIEGRRAGDLFPMQGSINAEIMRRGAGWIVPADEIAKMEGQMPILKDLWRAGVRSFMYVPLFFQDKHIGQMAFLAQKPGIYGERDLRLAESIAHQIAGAIANAQLFAERKRAEAALVTSEGEAKRLAKENGIIAEIGRIISSSLAIEDIYEKFAAEAGKLIDFDRLNVNLIDLRMQTGTIAYTHGAEIHQRTVGDTFPLQGSLSAAAIRGGTGLILHTPADAAELMQRYPVWLAPQSGFHSSMVVPLLNRSQTIGVLIFSSFREKGYAERDLRLANHIANQISGAIANAQLFGAAKRTQEALTRREQELEKNNAHLEELNSALKVLLRQLDENKSDLEKKVLTNIRKLVINFFAKLRKTQLNPHQLEYLNLIEDNLRRVTAPFLHNLDSKFLNLTPRELEIAYLIKEGRNTKEIGELLHVSPRSIEFHRDHLRKKLGLKERKANLRSYLSSLT